MGGLDLKRYVSLTPEVSEGVSAPPVGGQSDERTDGTPGQTGAWQYKFAFEIIIN